MDEIPGEKGDEVFVKEKTEDRQDRTKPGQEREKKRIPRSMMACYGYTVDKSGKLQINPSEADIVFYIFDSFISGQSLGQIAAALGQMGVVSPSGKPVWSRATLSNILSNEKYVGDVMLGRSRDSDHEAPQASQPQQLLRDHHPALISRSVFEIAQKEKMRRQRERQLGRKKVREGTE